MRAARREAVETAALALFARRGYHDVTVEEICAESGVSPATFYRYFRAKDDVLFGYEATVRAALREAVAVAGPQLAGPTALPAVLQAFAAAWQEQAPGFLLRERIIMGQPELMGRAVLVQLGWENDLAEALRPSAGPRARLWAAVAVAVLRAAWQEWAAGEADSLASAVLDGLRAVGIGGDRSATVLGVPS